MHASQVIDHVAVLLGDPNKDYHSADKLLLHLNAALEDICDRSRSLRVASYHPLIEGQAMYGLPDSFLEMDIVGIFHQNNWHQLFYTEFSTQLLRIFTKFSDTRMLPSQYTIWGQAHIEKHVATVVEPPENAETTDNSFYASDILNLGVRPGDRLVNITDDSEGVVIRLDAEDMTRVIFTGLAGGDDNRMEVGDEFRILSPQASRKNLVISPPPTKSDPEGTESLFVYYSRSHQEITQQRIDNGNDILEIDTEFASTLRHRMCYYASLDENGLDHPATQDFDAKYETYYATAIVPVGRRRRQFISAHTNGTNQNITPRGQETITRTGDWSLTPF